MVKRISLIALAFIIAASSLMAQPKRPDPKERAARLKEKLSLTDEQTAKVEKIFADSQAKFEKEMGATEEERYARREAMKKMMDETHAEINKILTDEQKAEFKKLQEERREGMGRGPKGKQN